MKDSGISSSMTGELSSDVLERQFGETELEVLYQQDDERIIATRTAATGRVLELSHVRFRPEGTARFQDIHEAVRGGTSMGKAFRAEHVAFQRRLRAAYHTGLPSVLAGRFEAGEQATIIDLTVLAGTDHVPYADILEVYAPDVAWDVDPREADEQLAGRLTAFAKLLVANS
jgi:hypothetical protein